MKNRNNYKETWNALATGMESAKKFVSGFQEEGEFTRTALKTIEILRATVNVKPADEMPLYVVFGQEATYLEI